uniref:Major facilitator superfamily (MFS) profile domain-containing protein n=1 Tax=Timema cristinae TaxID=61476 RepID=A0A7R9CDU5_TIMCR|nr:unnamed protein product [Timema cristinae]
MEDIERHESSKHKKVPNNGTIEINQNEIVPYTPTSNVNSSYRKDAIDTASILRKKRKQYVRSHSMSACHINDYTAAEIRRIRERLLRTQRRPVTAHIRHFTRSQKLTLTSLALVDFLSFCSMSIMAPFFPKEASAKGMSESISGFVFSFYALIMFLSSPLFGKILPRVGARFLFMSGMFIAGSCNILFGLLVYINQYEIFTLYCFLVRGMEALGASAYATASYVFVVEVFPDNIGSVLVGGFGLPFYSLGVSMVAFVPINFLLLPCSDVDIDGKKSGSLLELIQVPSVVMISLVIVVISNIWGFLDPTLEPHLRQFNLSPEQVGLVFLMFSALYGVFSPVWGWMADKVNNHWSMMVWGLLTCTVGLLLLGPSPLLPFFDNTLWLNLVALSIMGVSVALTLLPTFQGVLDSAIEGGCSNELATYSMVAGVWSCMYSLGEVIGPSFGGFLLQHYGFPICSTVMAAMTFILAIMTLMFFVVKDARRLSGFDDGTDTCTTDTPPAEQQQDCSVSDSSSSCNEDSPLLTSSTDHDLYTQEKLDFFIHLAREGNNSAPNRLTDIKRTMCITGGGACEV